ncbi:LysR family transcriptional regulator [Streptomyces sp. RKAG293]|uniref:LysR family transcriptional regulator n=1 Tax=Streptomyces sp. RKAG293 TaxID=2893403 RepID=UPI0020342993|nr:LysR family transcriptional regulator [Streptomyces sp. RKAG293]MCM2416673.1 LysR family transcriptional regulator [Streptomyces sp. RKAG293]
MHLDLNLLTALDALLEEGSVSGAAASTHVTAPAMSRSLGRLRKVTGDQILVRSGHTMVPTTYALAVRAQVHELVQQAHEVLSPDREVDLSTLERVFTVRWHDALADACGPALLASVHRQAPGIRLRFVAEPSADTPDLRRGDVDLESGTGAPAAPDVRHRQIGQDRLVVVVRPGHPLAGAPLSAERYVAAEHVTVSRRGRLRDPVDDALADLGMERVVVAAAPTASTALRLVHGTDLVVSVPEASTRAARRQLGLLALPVPMQLPPIGLHLAWHRRHDNDRAHTWLREQAQTVLQALFAEPTTPERQPNWL